MWQSLQKHWLYFLLKLGCKESNMEMTKLLFYINFKHWNVVYTPHNILSTKNITG